MSFALSPEAVERQNKTRAFVTSEKYLAAGGTSAKTLEATIRNN